MIVSVASSTSTTAPHKEVTLHGLTAHGRSGMSLDWFNTATEDVVRHRQHWLEAHRDGARLCGVEQGEHICYQTAGGIDPVTMRVLPQHLGPHRCECRQEWPR